MKFSLWNNFIIFFFSKYLESNRNDLEIVLMQLFIILMNRKLRISTEIYLMIIKLIYSELLFQQWVAVSNYLVLHDTYWGFFCYFYCRDFHGTVLIWRRLICSSTKYVIESIRSEFFKDYYFWQHHSSTHSKNDFNVPFRRIKKNRIKKVENNVRRFVKWKNSLSPIAHVSMNWE